jgi:hypothetical protein
MCLMALADNFDINLSEWTERKHLNLNPRPSEYQEV